MSSLNNTEHTNINSRISSIDVLLGQKIDGPAVNSSDNGKILMVVNGFWDAVEISFAEEEEY